WLEEDGVRHADLPDVMDARAELEADPRGAGRILHLPGDHLRVLGDPRGMPGRVPVAGVRDVGEGGEGGVARLFRLLELARVLDRESGLGGELGDELALI